MNINKILILTITFIISSTIVLATCEFDSSGRNGCGGQWYSIDSFNGCYPTQTACLFAETGISNGNTCVNDSNCISNFCNNNGFCQNDTISYIPYGSSTDFTAINSSSVDLPVLDSPSGSITWLGTGLDFRGADFLNYVNTGSGFVALDSASLPADVNGSANITINNIDCANFDPSLISVAPGFYDNKEAVLLNGQPCVGNECVNYNCIVDTLYLEVSHFTSYAYGATANLTINDSSEPAPVAPNNAGTFYAYYTNLSNEKVSDGSCKISIPHLLITNDPMTDTGNHWEYTYSDVGTTDFTYTINCSSPTVTDLETSDLFDIQEPINAVPEFSTLTIIGIISMLGLFIFIRR